MVFRVLVNYNDRKDRALDVADTEKEFNNTTIRELKEKFKSQISGAPDPDDVRVIFGKDPLEDNLTLAYYKINHLNVLLIVMKMPGGGGPLPPEDEDKGMPRTASMEVLAEMQQIEPEPKRLCCMM